MADCAGGLRNELSQPAPAFPLASKRSLITTVWNWSGETLAAQDPILGDVLEGGIGSAGVGYATRRWAEFAANVLSGEGDVVDASEKTS